jgi:DNA-binding HxlR family transcriptional regulator
MSKLKDEYCCELNLTHDLIGGKWKTQVLWHIANGDNRFSLLEKVIPGITQKVLASQIRELEEDGLIEKNIIGELPPKIIIYRICQNNSEILSLLENMCTFTEAYAKRNGIRINRK